MLEGWKAFVLPVSAATLLAVFFAWRCSVDDDGAMPSADPKETAPPASRREQIEAAAAAEGSAAPPLPDRFRESVQRALDPIIARCREPRASEARLALAIHIEVAAAEGVGAIVRSIEVSGAKGSAPSRSLATCIRRRGPRARPARPGRHRRRCIRPRGAAVIWILLTAGATAAMLVADRSANKRALRVFKPLASAGFLGLAWSASPLDNPYGTAILAALVLSFVGDICLLSNRARWFLAGLVAFACAHIGYVVAFARFEPSTLRIAVYAAALLIPAALIHRWLLPHVERAMRAPVLVYMGIITVMLATAAAAIAADAPSRVLIGAALFYASDLAVARDRFVAPGFTNRAWGLPTYYAAQLVLASTVAG